MNFEGFTETALQTTQKLVADVVYKGLFIHPTGSRVTAYFNPNESDMDFVIYDPDSKLSDSLVDSHDWEKGGSEREGSDFNSWRHNRIRLNFILVKNKEYFSKCVIATELLKITNPKNKTERIRIFNMVFGSLNECPF